MAVLSSLFCPPVFRTSGHKHAAAALVVRRVVCGNPGGNLALLHGAAQVNDRQQGEDEMI